MRKRRLGVLLIPLLFAVGEATPLTRGQGPGKNVERVDRVGAGDGKSLAILIGVQDYAAVGTLKYCRNDVKRLEQVLREICRYDRVVTLTEDAPETRYRPTLGNLFRELGLWLRVANSGSYERVLVFFSGHGFRDEKGRLYLAPPDCDPANLIPTGLPVSYVQQMLDGCTNAKVKLLILDCCHAGAGKGEGVGVDPTTVAAVFRNARGLITIASCEDKERSLEWDAKRQGLFSFWLCEGLSGAADRDHDGLVDHDELYRYVFTNVQETAAEQGSEQTVVLRPSEDWRGIAVLSHRPTPTIPPRQVKPPTIPPRQVKPVIENSIGMRLVRIPAGEFAMGSLDGDKEAQDDEKPQHRVQITRPFYLGVYEVTQGEYETVMGRNPSYFSAQGGGKDWVAGQDMGRHPVESVSWNDAIAFCNKLSEREGLPPYYQLGAGSQLGGDGYRLPTEAEWEYACRAGSGTRYSFGDDMASLSEFAWYNEDDTKGATHSVGQKRPNAFGLFDMHGNVWEWCWDGYEADYYQKSPVADPSGPPQAALRVRRGGAGASPR